MGILQHCLKWIESPNYDPSKASPAMRYFKAQNYRESDIEMFINKVDNVLEKYGINQIETPDPNIDVRYQIDENKLEQSIIDTYTIYNPDLEISEKASSIQKDIQSISAIHKLRKDKRSQNIKQAGHIFITANSALAYASKIFETKEYGQDFYTPTCTTDTFIGTLIWLKNPQKVIEINKGKIITNIYAALQPSEQLLKRYLIEIEKLKDETITEDDYLLLRDSQVAKELLSEGTLGDPGKFTSKTPIEILDKIKKEAEKKYMQEKIEHEKTKDMLESEKEEKGRLLENLDRSADKIATYGAYLVLGLFVVLSFASWLNIPNNIIKWVVSILLLLFSIGSILGIYIKTIKERIKKMVILKFLGAGDGKHDK